MPRTKADKQGPNPVDVQVGARLKSRRLMLGLSQEELAQAVGITFQQIQKYERGANRVSASRLVDICRALKTSTDYFFEGANGQRLQMKGVSDNKQEGLEPDPLTQKDVVELIRAYSNIDNPQIKKQLLEMAKAMSSAEDKKSKQNQ